MTKGRGSRRWSKLRAQQRAKRLPCWICGQPINYEAEWPDSDSFSVDHERPLSTYPEGAEDPANLRSAHLGCNSSRGARAPRPTLGATSREW